MKHATDVDIDHAVPFIDLQFLKFRQRHYASIVDDNIDAPVRFQREARERLNVFEARNIERPKLGFTTRIPNLPREFLETIRAARTEHNTRALAGQHPSGGFSD